MLSDKSTVCPFNLLDIAHQKRGAKAAIVNAGKRLPMLSIMDCVKEKLIIPVFIGDEIEIKKTAEELKFDISEYEIINEPVENNTAKIAAKLAGDGKVKIIVKGHIHTDILMKEVLLRKYNLIGKKRLSHIWHMTLDKEDKPLIITDGALNVNPNVKTKMHILKNVVDFCHRIKIARPKVSILSATEEVLDSIQSSLDAKEICELLVPNVETGNALVKMMIYFMGACAAGVVIGGKVPVVITSRSDDATARLASIAAAVVALD